MHTDCEVQQVIDSLIERHGEYLEMEIDYTCAMIWLLAQTLLTERAKRVDAETKLSQIRTRLS